jgi:hypothetical protein
MDIGDVVNVLDSCFRNISDKDIATAVKKINNRPRKRLNYQTHDEATVRPYEVVVHFEAEFADLIDATSASWENKGKD